MSEIREYTHVEMHEKVLTPDRGPKTVIRGTVQLKATSRMVLYRDMTRPETLIATCDGHTIEYPWTMVVSARVTPANVVPLQSADKTVGKR